MQTLLYDGSFDGFLCAIFDVYEYKFFDVVIRTASGNKGNIFSEPKLVNMDTAHSQRVWKGLEKKLMKETLDKIYRCFLSELPEREDNLLAYVRYVFASEKSIEGDFSNFAVIWLNDTAKKVYREKHRMEAFVRFQKTSDGLFYSMVEPDFNVLPLIATHFEKRYADQCWLIYDNRRKYGIHYDLDKVSEVKISFTEQTSEGREIEAIHDENEILYQDLWAAYFNSVNIKARKNTKLHLQHMPLRYWKYLPEKQRAALRK